MKTVEERVAEVKAEVQMKPITGFAYVIECVAKQLTQQAAEWQIALKEAVEAERKASEFFKEQALATVAKMEKEIKGCPAAYHVRFARRPLPVSEPERPTTLEELAARLINRFEEVLIEEGMKAILCYKPVDDRPKAG